jgi:hypothetical protein
MPNVPVAAHRDTACEVLRISLILSLITLGNIEDIKLRKPSRPPDTHLLSPPVACGK